MLNIFEKDLCKKTGLILIFCCFTAITYAGFPGIEFTDGSSFTPSVTPGETDQAIGRFSLQVGFESATLTEAAIKLNGTRTGMTNLKLWSSTDATFGGDSQQGSTIGADPGTGNSVTFNSFTSSIAALPSVSYFFLTADVASNATGVIRGVIVNNSSLVFTGEATLNQTINNAPLSSGDVSLPVELTSFTAASTRSDAITLIWVTESEIENLGFILERRTSASEWKEIASYQTHSGLQGQGSVTHRTNYSFTDETVEQGKTYDYRLADVSYNGAVEYHSMTLLGISPADLPTRFQVYPAYPNPFNPVTTIQYELPDRSDVQITIYDLLGKTVAKLVSENQDAGYKSVQWDATNISSGMYFYQIRAGEYVQTKKLVLLK